MELLWLEAIGSRAPFMEEVLRHSFEALPKTGRCLTLKVFRFATSCFSCRDGLMRSRPRGRCRGQSCAAQDAPRGGGGARPRLSAHPVRLFLQVHSWQMKAADSGRKGRQRRLLGLGSQDLRPVAGAWHEHSPTTALKRAPAKLNWAQLGLPKLAASCSSACLHVKLALRAPRHDAFDQKLQQHGLSLNAARRLFGRMLVLSIGYITVVCPSLSSKKVRKAWQGPDFSMLALLNMASPL